MKYKPALGDLVRIGFRDHSQGGAGGLNFFAIGKLIKITRRDYTIACWYYMDPTQEDLENVETFSIVRRAITRIDRLVVAAPPKP